MSFILIELSWKGFFFSSFELEIDQIVLRVFRVKEVSRGYFHDYNSLRNHGGKAFMAPGTLIREDVSISPYLFPYSNSGMIKPS